jgi:hypothetical protein
MKPFASQIERAAPMVCSTLCPFFNFITLPPDKVFYFIFRIICLFWFAARGKKVLLPTVPRPRVLLLLIR